MGGKSAFYYLPLTIAERLGYFKEEGLDVEISDFDGGSKALQAVVGGSADVVSGAWENTIDQQPKGLNMQGFVLQGRYPAISVGIVKAKAASYKSPKDLKGMKIGVSAPGSSTNRMVLHLLAKDGLKGDDVSFIGVGTSAGVDRCHHYRPDRRGVQRRSGDDHAGDAGDTVTLIADTRTAKGTRSCVRQRRHARGGAVCADQLHPEEPQHRAGADQRHGARADMAADVRRRSRFWRPCRLNIC